MNATNHSRISLERTFMDNSLKFVTLNKRILVTNIVQVVKKCYKRKIDSRDLRGRFLCFLQHPTPPYSPFKASLYCKWSTVGV